MGNGFVTGEGEGDRGRSFESQKKRFTTEDTEATEEKRKAPQMAEISQILPAIFPNHSWLRALRELGGERPFFVGLAMKNRL